MSKRERIEELKKKLVEAHANNEKWRSETRKLEAEKHAKVAFDKLIKQDHEKTAKLAREQEAIDLLKLGYVKVETLRGMVSAEYEVNGSPSIDITKFSLRLKSTDRLEDALRAAILEKKPKFATGGYTGKNPPFAPSGLVGRASWVLDTSPSSVFGGAAA